jgi:hypothetical protein
MKQFRMGRIVLLTVLIIIGATTNIPAKTITSYAGVGHFAGTQWRVTQIDGADLPEYHSDITISFSADAIIHVDQGCMGFSASADGDGGMNIALGQSADLCDTIYPNHFAVLRIFEKFDALRPMNDGRFRLPTTDGRTLIAAPLPVANDLHLPVVGGLIVRPVMSTPLTIELDGPEVFQGELTRCKYAGKIGGRVLYQFEISWGDGTVSNLQSGPDGEPCQGIERHTYAGPGHYHVTVRISTIGSNDGQRPIYSGEMDVTLL